MYIYIYVYTYITLCMYYYNMENFVSFLFKFGINIRKTIRLIENTDKKLINAELALLFNETCKNGNILPKKF